VTKEQEQDQIKERFDVIVLNRKLGTCSGFDELDEFALIFYDYKPVEQLKALGTGELSVIYEEDILQVSQPIDQEFDAPDEDEEIFEKKRREAEGPRFDIIHAIAHLPLYSTTGNVEVAPASPAEEDSQVTSE
jgi:hypothetical protein